MPAAPDERPLLFVPPNAGGQLDPHEVYGRDEKVRAAIERLREGRHLLLDEPRRFGKSSFAQLLCTRLAETEGLSGLYHSVQGDTTLVKFVESVLDALSSAPGARRLALGEALTGVLESVKDVQAGPVSLSIAYRRDPLAALRTAVARADKVAGRAGQRLVLCLDELTETIGEIGKDRDGADARELLAELRRLRENHRHVSWIFTGSIGFHHVLHGIGSTSAQINDLRSFVLGPLEPAWARWLAGSVLLGAGVGHAAASDPGLRAAIAETTDGIPILVHMIGEHVRDHAVTPHAEQVGEVLDACFRSLDRSRNLTHLLTRLGTYYGPREAAAAKALDRTAREPLARPALLALEGVDAALLDLLEADHYLARDRVNRLTWKYQSLARLWTTRVGALE